MVNHAHTNTVTHTRKVVRKVENIFEVEIRKKKKKKKEKKNEIETWGNKKIFLTIT